MIDIKAHPIVTNYGADVSGNIYNIKTNKLLKKRTDKFGYETICISFNNKIKNYRVSRLIYECFWGALQPNDVIDHHNDNKSDNTITNLRKLTQQENIKKKYVGGRRFNNIKKRVRAINLKNNMSKDFKSMSNASKQLNICEPSIRRVCENIQRSAISKFNGQHYSFKYI